MTYKDILSKYRFELSDTRCLIWSADYEYKPACVGDEIHRNAAWVWLQVHVDGIDIVLKYERDHTGGWKLCESSDGKISFGSGNPFSNISVF